eukprot:6179521-Pleurochrysis_carterae.AAC.1
MYGSSYKTLLAVDGGNHARSRRPALRRAIALGLMCRQVGDVSCSSTYSRAAFTRVVSCTTHLFGIARLTHFQQTIDVRITPVKIFFGLEGSEGCTP